MTARPVSQTATSTNLPVLVLEFIRRYFVSFGASPSLGEIANEFRINRERARRLTRELRAAGELDWTPGLARSFRLPDASDHLSDSQLMMLLKRRGITVVRDTTTVIIEAVAGANLPPAVTKLDLPLMNALDHIPGSAEVVHGDGVEQLGGAAASSPADRARPRDSHAGGAPIEGAG